MSEKLKQNSYWKSLGELARNEEYKKYSEREFPEGASELTDQVSRRSFLRVMGASIALAGFASCRRPVQKIVPFSEMPENVIQGEPLFYATSRPFQGSLRGLIVENNEGRPTKLEGNPDHPSSRGRTSILDQAEILSMYDPDRSRSIRRDGEVTDADAFASFVAENLSNTDQRIAVISEANSSPTLQRLRQQAESRFPNMSWVTYEAFDEEAQLEGANMVFGRRLRTLNRFEEADVVVAFDADPVNPLDNSDSVRQATAITDRRRVLSTSDSMSRIYAVESSFTNTGSYADHRLKLKASQIEPFIYALASRLSDSVSGLEAFAGVNNEFISHDWVARLAADLLENQGRSLLTAGRLHSPSVHAAVAAINVALDNEGTTVSWLEVPHIEQSNQREAFASLVLELQAGDIDTLLILGANPVFTAPADLDFGAAITQAGTVIHLADYYDETSKLSNWHVNRAHFLEAWGDGHSFSGTRSVIQPQIQPLFDGWSEIELLNLITTGERVSGYDLVRETWSSLIDGNFENGWERVLHDGLHEVDAFETASVSVTEDFAGQISTSLNATAIDGFELVIKPDSTLFDGRYANNSWLQELPDTMTKITWDNVALISPATATQLGISLERGLSDRDTDVIRIQADGAVVEMPVWIQPGHADNSITVSVGYGRQGIGRVADGVGVNTYPLRTSDALYVKPAEVTSTGRTYEIATVQDHHNIEGRNLVREESLEGYRENPEFASFESWEGYGVPGLAEGIEEGHNQPVTLFTPHHYPDHEPQWGMAIDLNACFGCNVCTIACQAENNIPVVGKREVSRRRMMHWIRVDRYFEGDTDNPTVMHQPVPCMHCELAPCEQVCPVAATTHSDDGINQMTYNRCIGTRYCANNCPYKVRRFNFFNYSKEFLTTGDDPEIVQMAMNPEVTVRFRGVMEKCTYCVQRTNRAKREARLETGSRKPADGAVMTACQQACPSGAIHFGDLTDPDSHIVQMKRNERNYDMLVEISTRPRTSYMGKIRNTNPELGDNHVYNNR